MTSQKFRSALPAACLGLAIAGLISCGSDHSTSQTPAKRNVQGAVVKGPVRQATVTATAIDEGGDPSGDTATATTDDNGLFSFNLAPFSDTLMLVATTGGSYVDESDTAPNTEGDPHPRVITLVENEGFEAVLPVNATTVAVTPYSMALLLRARRESHGANFSAFYQAVLAQATAAFGFDPSTVIPANPANPASGSDPKAQQYALLLGGASNAINAMATELGIQPNYQLVRAFIDDLSDGTLDGKLVDTPISITIGETSTHIPADVSLNNEILRFRNNNFSKYAGVQLVQVDGLSAATTPPANLKPFAKDDSIIVAQDATANTLVGGADSVLANDQDIGGGHGTLTATLVGTAQRGIATLTPDGKFTYKPNPPVRPATYYFGPDSFTYKATNANQVDSAPGTVAISITKINHAPIADDIAQISVDENSTPTPGNVAFYDPDGDTPLTVSKVTDPAHGTLTLNSDGSFTYKPNANYSGPDSFKFKVNDGTVDSSPATVNIIVAHGTHKPVAVDDTFPANKGTTPTHIAAPGVLANDTDQDGDSLTVANAPNAPQPTSQGGSVTLRTDGSFDYTPPNANFTGNDTFTYKVSDGTQPSDNAATVTLNVSNQPPVAQNDSYSVAHDKVLTVSAANGVRANDTDGDAFTANKLTDPAHGTVALATDGSFIYTPNAGFVGSDSFTYQDKDTANQLSSPATVSINVTDANAPSVQATPSSLPNARESNDYTITLVGTDADAGDVVKFFVTTLPAHDSTYTGTTLHDGAKNGPIITSTTQVVSGPIFVHTGTITGSSQNTTANDSFQVVAFDGARQSTPPVTVSLTIARDLHEPVACPQPTDVATADCAVNPKPVVQENSTDNTIPLFGHDADGDPLTFIITALPAHGTLKDVSGGNSHSIIAGDLPYTLSTSSSAKYTPAPDQKQADSFGFKVNDGVEDCNTDNHGTCATVNITVANKVPVAANDGPFSTNQNTPLAVNTACAAPQAALKGVLCNDTDTADDIGTLQAVNASAPAHGNVTLNTDGSFTYTPSPDTYTGPDSFTYQAKDSSGGLSTAATVSINVGAAPVAKTDSYSTNHGIVLNVPAPGVLANDVKASNADPALQALLIGGTTLPHGTLAFNSDGSFTYTPSSATFVGSDSFQYRAIETGFPPSAPATVTISIGNHAPVAVDQPSAGTNEDTALVVHLAGTDADNDPLTFSKVALPAHGTLGAITPVDSTHADVTYTPALNYNGPDSFNFKANDGAVDSNTATVSITINPVNDPPVAVNDNYSTIHDVVLSVAAPGVLGNDTDPDVGDSKTAVNASVPSHGSVVLNTNGGFTYTPNAGFAGSDSFTYQAKDAANALSNTGTVNITITNATPVATGEFLGSLLQDSPTATIPAPGVLSNDKDADNTSPPLYAGLTAVLDAVAQHGTITLNSDGSWQYSPAQGYSGPDSFTYHAFDGVHSSNVVTASLFVDAIPVANNDTASILSTASQLVVSAANGVLANDTDATAGTSGATLTAVKDTDPECGTVTLNSNGGFTYTVGQGGVCSSDSFTYHAVESIHGAASNSAMVTINCSDCNFGKRLRMKK